MHQHRICACGSAWYPWYPLCVDLALVSGCFPSLAALQLPAAGAVLCISPLHVVEHPSAAAAASVAGHIFCVAVRAKPLRVPAACVAFPGVVPAAPRGVLGALVRAAAVGAPVCAAVVALLAAAVGALAAVDAAGAPALVVAEY